MNTSSETPSADSLPPAPYVGMRPFEKGEKDIFFGRDRDAALLRDKVFSERLTIFYGPSGMGKSSVLRTLLIPCLEEQEAQAIYFDAWRGSDPTATLKARLVAEATKLKVPDAGAGAPSLTDLVRLLISVDDRTVVLILDQFEELFATDGQRLDQLRQEIGRLVRTPGLDVRVLLSLREEHLASLEPFRAVILNLFQSTYRLEPLDNETSVPKTIEGPAGLFGVSYEPNLVKQLVADMRQEPSGTVATPGIIMGEVPVDLPILQLVCSELWKAKKSEDKIIWLDLYQRLGFKPGIVDAYIRRVMPQRWKDKCLTAEIMRQLAPPDGHKVSFSAAHLAAMTELPLKDIQTELERLSNPEVRVLRSRKYGTGNVLYELWHDSFIRIIEPWRDAILKRITFRRWALGVTGTLALIAIVSGLVLWLADRQNLLNNTEEVMRKSDLSITQKFDHVSNYLLWNRTGSKRLDHLKELLDKYQSYLPQGYGVDVAGIDLLTLPDQNADWPLTLHYSSARKLDQYAFTLAWQLFAQELNKKWNIPVPLRLRLVSEDTYPKEKLELTGDEIEPLEFNLPVYEQDAIILDTDKKNLSVSGQEFLNRFNSEWKEQQYFDKVFSALIVPRWSLPAWKASGVTAIDGSGLPAIVLIYKIFKNPDRALTPNAVEVLLQRMADQYPFTVAEVRAVRGDRLPRDLQELTKNGHKLNGLPTLLDVLANYSDESPEKIAEKIRDNIDSPQTVLILPLKGPHSSDAPVAKAQTPSLATAKEVHDAYREATLWLPPVEPEIRVYLGKELDGKWIMEDKKYNPQFREQIEMVRIGVFRRFGILPPLPEVRRASWEPNLGSNEFRIEALSQSKEHPLAAPISTASGIPLDRFSDSLMFRYEALRIHFLDSESVNAFLSEMEQGLSSWLRNQYSLTDLKLLLRAVVNLSNDEFDDRRHALQAETVGKTFEIPEENNIRHPAWLLASLVFWSQVHDLYSLPDMSEDLRATQRARMRNDKSRAIPNDNISKFVRDGIHALAENHIAKAEAAFSHAVKTDKALAVSYFPTLYATELKPSLIRNLTKSCNDWKQPSLSVADIVDLEDLLAEKDFDQSVDVATDRRLRLCLLAAYPEIYRQSARTLTIDLVKRYGPVDNWPADEAAWFGKELLASFDPLSDKPSIVSNGLIFLKSSLPQLKGEEASQTLSEALTICQKPGPSRWCWDLLASLTGVLRDPQSLVTLGFAFSNREVRSDLENAIALADQTKVQLQHASMSKKERDWWRAWADLTRAEALMGLSQVNDGDSLKEAKDILTQVLGSPALGSEPYLSLAELMLREDRSKEAMNLLDETMKKWPDDANLWGKMLIVKLLAGDKDGLSKFALDALKKKGTDPDAFGFISALGLLLTTTDPWEQAARVFLSTSHKYVPYVAMLLTSRMTGKSSDQAQEIIQLHWSRAKPSTWKARLQEGDETAWREMLIGYYVGNGEVQRENIFGDLEDEARFAQSELQHLPMSRRSLLCEAYFYDALLAESKGDKVQRNALLERVLGTDARDYFEYGMAKFILAQEKH